MGKQESSLLTYVDLYLEIVNITATAGEALNGVVHIDLKKPIRSQNISLRLDGFEKSKWNFPHH